MRLGTFKGEAQIWRNEKKKKINTNTLSQAFFAVVVVLSFS